jgi:hypothetical protein
MGTAENLDDEIFKGRKFGSSVLQTKKTNPVALGPQAIYTD